MRNIIARNWRSIVGYSAVCLRSRSSSRGARKLLDQIAGAVDGLALPNLRRRCRARDGDLG